MNRFRASIKGVGPQALSVEVIEKDKATANATLA
jgi:hypothetical protein